MYILPMCAALKDYRLFKDELKAKCGALLVIVWGVLFSMGLGIPMAALSWAGVIDPNECP